MTKSQEKRMLEIIKVADKKHKCILKKKGFCACENVSEKECTAKITKWICKGVL